MFFIDESGSIPKFRDTRYKNRFFVIAFVHTDDQRKVRNVYKRAIQKLKEKYPLFFASLPNPNECKGSEMPPFMKLYIIEKLLLSTDIKIAQMVVFNPEVDQRFREKPGRSFNYLIKLIVMNSSLSANDIRQLELHIDNRNTALRGLSELEGYLYNEMVLAENRVSKVKVHYHESCDNYNIQVADLMASIIYQRFRYKTMPFPDYATIHEKIDLMHPFTNEYLYNKIRPRIVVPFIYPLRSDLQKEAAAGISLL